MFRCFLVPVSQQLVGEGGGGVIRVLENPIFKQTRPKPELPNQFAISHPLPPQTEIDRGDLKYLFMWGTPPPLLRMILIHCYETKRPPRWPKNGILCFVMSSL